MAAKVDGGVPADYSGGAPIEVSIGTGKDGGRAFNVLGKQVQIQSLTIGGKELIKGGKLRADQKKIEAIVGKLFGEEVGKAILSEAQKGLQRGAIRGVSITSDLITLHGEKEDRLNDNDLQEYYDGITALFVAHFQEEAAPDEDVKYADAAADEGDEGVKVEEDAKEVKGEADAEPVEGKEKVEKGEDDEKEPEAKLYPDLWEAFKAKHYPDQVSDPKNVGDIRSRGLFILKSQKNYQMARGTSQVGHFFLGLFVKLPLALLKLAVFGTWQVVKFLPSFIYDAVQSERAPPEKEEIVWQKNFLETITPALRIRAAFQSMYHDFNLAFTGKA